MTKLTTQKKKMQIPVKKIKNELDGKNCARGRRSQD
jgi:hypothetical protein